jgi:hypothetical protein
MFGVSSPRYRVWIKKKGIEVNKPNFAIELTTIASYSGGSEFKSRLGVRMSWLMFFVVFLSSYRQVTGYYLEISHVRSLPSHFQFIIHFSSYLFAVYLTTLSVDQISYRMIEWLMNWEGFGKKWPWSNLRSFPGICLEGLRKTTKNLSW